MIFTNVESVANVARACCSANPVIVIDGWIGSGKSTLAEALAADIGALHFDLDSALLQDQGNYVPSLDLGVIRNAIIDRTEPLVVSGICALQVFEKVGVRLDFYVYVKRMAIWGWADEQELAGGIPEVPGASGEVVRNELRAYHQKWKPHVLATHEYHRSG